MQLCKHEFRQMHAYLHSYLFTHAAYESRKCAYELQLNLHSCVIVFLWIANGSITFLQSLSLSVFPVRIFIAFLATVVLSKASSLSVAIALKALLINELNMVIDVSLWATAAFSHRIKYFGSASTATIFVIALKGRVNAGETATEMISPSGQFVHAQSTTW